MCGIFRKWFSKKMCILRGEFFFWARLCNFFAPEALCLRSKEGLAKFALEAKFDEFGAGSLSRKLSYPVGHRQFAKNPNPATFVQDKKKFNRMLGWSG